MIRLSELNISASDGFSINNLDAKHQEIARSGKYQNKNVVQITATDKMVLWDLEHDEQLDNLSDPSILLHSRYLSRTQFVLHNHFEPSTFDKSHMYWTIPYSQKDGSIGRCVKAYSVLDNLEFISYLHAPSKSIDP